MFTITLTDSEISDRSQSLAQQANKLIELEEEEETIKAEYKRTMADIRERRIEISSKIRKLSRAVRLGVEGRDGQKPLFDYGKEVEPERRVDEFEKTVDRLTEVERVNGEQAVKELFGTDTTSNIDLQEGYGQGTSFPTEHSQEEINRIARFAAGIQIKEGAPLKLCHIQNEPFVITKVGDHNDEGNWLSVEAWHVLPEANAGEGKTYEASFTEDYLNVRINTRTKKKPDWWVIVGPRQVLTVKPSHGEEVSACLQDESQPADIETGRGSKKRWRTKEERIAAAINR